MPTPGHLARRADFYHQLGQLTGAGLGVVQALEHQARIPSDPTLQAPLRTMLQQLGAGATLADAVRATGPALPPFDQALIEAAERSGRLPRVFGMLANHYLARSQMLRQTLSSLAYPVLVLHLALFVMGLLEVVRGGSVLLGAGKLVLLLGLLYGGVGWVWHAAFGRRGAGGRAITERVLRRVPWLGLARQDLALARLAAALEALLAAGINVLEAWPMAVRVTDSPALQAAVAAWPPRLEAGATPAEVMAQTPQFPEFFTNLYRTGEISGKLEESLQRLHAVYFDQGMTRLKAFVDWLPRVLFLGVALLAGYVVIRFWMGYFQTLSQSIGL